MTENIVRELDAWSENTPDAELRSLLNRAGDHIEFLETQMKIDSIDAVDYDDRKQLLELFQDTLPGRTTVEGPLVDLYGKLLAVARWGAQQAFERMTERRADDETVSDRVAEAWAQAATVAETDAVGVTLRDVNDFAVVAETGKRIAFNIRARAQRVPRG